MFNDSTALRIEDLEDLNEIMRFTNTKEFENQEQKFNFNFFPVTPDNTLRQLGLRVKILELIKLALSEKIDTKIFCKDETQSRLIIGINSQDDFLKVSLDFKELSLLCNQRDPRPASNLIVFYKEILYVLGEGTNKKVSINIINFKKDKSSRNMFDLLWEYLFANGKHNPQLSLQINGSDDILTSLMGKKETGSLSKDPLVIENVKFCEDNISNLAKLLFTKESEKNTFFEEIAKKMLDALGAEDLHIRKSITLQIFLATKFLGKEHWFAMGVGDRISRLVQAELSPLLSSIRSFTENTNTNEACESYVINFLVSIAKQISDKNSLFGESLRHTFKSIIESHKIDPNRRIGIKSFIDHLLPENIFRKLRKQSAYQAMYAIACIIGVVTPSITRKKDLIKQEASYENLENIINSFLYRNFTEGPKKDAGNWLKQKLDSLKTEESSANEKDKKKFAEANPPSQQDDDLPPYSNREMGENEYDDDELLQYADYTAPSSSNMFSSSSVPAIAFEPEEEMGENDDVPLLLANQTTSSSTAPARETSEKSAELNVTRSSSSISNILETLNSLRVEDHNPERLANIENAPEVPADDPSALISRNYESSI